MELSKVWQEGKKGGMNNITTIAGKTDFFNFLFLPSLYPLFKKCELEFGVSRSQKPLLRSPNLVHIGYFFIHCSDDWRHVFLLDESLAFQLAFKDGTPIFQSLDVARSTAYSLFA